MCCAYDRKFLLRCDKYHHELSEDDSLSKAKVSKIYYGCSGTLEVSHIYTEQYMISVLWNVSRRQAGCIRQNTRST